MRGFRFPNETDDYRAKREELLELEMALRQQSEDVAQKRRELVPGGKLKEPYEFHQKDRDDQITTISFEKLFESSDSLILYSMMFGPEWDAPCPSCTSIVDAIHSNAHAVKERCALAVVAAATAEQLYDWRAERGWAEINLVSGNQNSYLLDYCGYEGTTDPAMVSNINVFQKKPEGIFHFWASEIANVPMDNGHPRHVDTVWPLWNLFDMLPEGRGDAIVPRQNYVHEYFSKNILEE